MPSAPPTGARAPIGQGSPSAFGVFVARPGADPIPPPGAAGSSSMLQRLTVRLAETLSLVDPRRTAGAPANRRLLTKPSTRCSKRPHDNELGDLVVSVSDVIENGETGEGFEVLSALGKGTFGQVFKVRSLVSGDIFALKVIRSRQALRKQAETEVGILQSLCLPDSASGPPTPRETEGGAKAPLAGAPDDAAGRQAKGTDPRSLMVQLHEHFSHREHVCLVFEALGVNLLQLLQQNGCRGLSLSLVRFFSKQLLQALILLRQLGVIHCDLKPENILLRNLQSPAIKIIDFGSACYEQQQPTSSYIQSRFYRSPEVLLSHPYGCEIDTWSLGCIVGEFFLGLPLFPGESEYNQLCRIVEMLGARDAASSRDETPRRDAERGREEVERIRGVAEV